MWYFFPFTLLVRRRKGIRPVKNWVLVCWWQRFDWKFAHLTAPAVTTTSIILSSNKNQNRDILVPANRVVLENGHKTTVFSILKYIYFLPYSICWLTAGKYPADIDVIMRWVQKMHIWFLFYWLISPEITPIAPFAITINSNVCPHIRVLNTLMRESYAWRHTNTLFPQHVRQLYRITYGYFLDLRLELGLVLGLGF